MSDVPTPSSFGHPEAFYFGRKNATFGLLHRTHGDAKATVVIVEPFGIEALAADATFRSLTSRLLTGGFHVLRFSPPGAGDSTDLESVESIVPGWLEAIADAVDVASTFAAGTVDVVALRLGATIAAHARPRARVRRMVLWAPVAGKAFTREFKLLGASAHGAARPSDQSGSTNSDAAGSPAPPALEAGGFVLSHTSVAELAELDLRTVENLPADDVLLVDRDDLRSMEKVRVHLDSRGIRTAVTVPVGYAAMRLDDPEEGEIPEDAVGEVVEWLSVRPKDQASAPGPVPGLVTSPTLVFSARGGALEEAPVWIRPSGAALFGIVTRRIPDTTGVRFGPLSPSVVVLLTTGSNPRCGAGRLQVRMARRLAAEGHVVLRYDRRGIGASTGEGVGGKVVRMPPAEGAVDSYDDVHLLDAQHVVDFVTAEYGCETVTLIGMCSGAYTAFHAAAAHAVRAKVHLVILINQILFLDRVWTTKEESPAMAVKAGYELRHGWHDLRKWKALFNGSISIPMTVRRLARLARLKGGKHFGNVLERTGVREPGALATHLQRIHEAGIEQLYVFDDAETGLGYMSIEAGELMKRLAVKRGLQVTTVAGAGHIFAPAASKDWLEELLVSSLAGRLRP